MKTVLLIGLGNFGISLAKSLSELGHQIMVVDKDEQCVNDVLPFVTSAQIGDSTNEAFLRSLGVDNYDACFVAIGNDFQSSLETTSLLKELGAKLVIARADRDVQAKFLLRNGADEYINPEKQVAKWAAIRYTSDHILDYVQLDSEHAIVEAEVPKDWVGKSISSIDIRKKYSINIMALKKDGQLDLNFTPDTVLKEDHSLLVLGDNKAIQKCFKM